MIHCLFHQLGSGHYIEMARKNAVPRWYSRLVALALLTAVAPICAEEPASPIKFEAQEIAKDLKIGYAVTVADINGDGKPDIIVVDKHRVVWYENPTWKVH